MTVYFMRSLKKISTIFIIISIVLVVLNILIYPDVNKIVIKDVVISNENGENYVSFNQDISLDFTIREAIDNGIPLAFKIRLDIVEKNDILPTKTIKREVRYYQIEYKSLRKIYKITDINDEKYEYKNMGEAIKKIIKVKNFKFSFIDRNLDYELWLTVSLDRKKLPKPLQVNYFDRTWFMTSEKSIHKLGNLN